MPHCVCTEGKLCDGLGRSHTRHPGTTCWQLCVQANCCFYTHTPSPDVLGVLRPPPVLQVLQVVEEGLVLQVVVLCQPCTAGWDVQQQ